MTRTMHNDGGPAFPLGMQSSTHNGDTMNFDHGTGMSLRDWFAGQALPEAYKRVENMRAITPDDERKLISMACYSIADAMLTERKRT